MIQKGNRQEILKVFLTEPTSIHFIREISKKTKIATPSVKNYLNEFLKGNLIIPKESHPFNGYAANRENEKFVFYKRVYNLYSLYELKEVLNKNYSPKLAVVFGSYSLGEDVENSDIDLLIVSKSKQKIDLSKFEKEFNKEINILITDNLSKIEKPILNKIYNGFVICGGFDLI